MKVPYRNRTYANSLFFSDFELTLKLVIAMSYRESVFTLNCDVLLQNYRTFYMQIQLTLLSFEVINFTPTYTSRIYDVMTIMYIKSYDRNESNGYSLT